MEIKIHSGLEWSTAYESDLAGRGIRPQLARIGHHDLRSFPDDRMGAPGPAHFMGVLQTFPQRAALGLARPDCSHDAVFGASEHPSFVLVQRLLQCHAETGCEGI